MTLKQHFNHTLNLQVNQNMAKERQSHTEVIAKNIHLIKSYTNSDIFLLLQAIGWCVFIIPMQINFFEELSIIE